MDGKGRNGLNEVCFTTYSEAQTEQLGAALAGALFPGAFLALQGELGAGKTAFARGVARGLAIEGVNSPTFMIVQEYAGALPLYHFDAYRLRCGEELQETGFADYLRMGGVILMEWPEHVHDALPSERLDIAIIGSGDAPRSICMRASAQMYLPLLQAAREKERREC